jgi:hypothetical protein
MARRGEVGGELSASCPCCFTPLPQGKSGGSFPVSIGQEAGWGPETVWMKWRSATYKHYTSKVIIFGTKLSTAHKNYNIQLNPLILNITLYS